MSLASPFVGDRYDFAGLSSLAWMNPAWAHSSVL